LGGFGIVAPVSQKVEPPRYTGQFTVEIDGWAMYSWRDASAKLTASTVVAN